jgi:rRNA-processing protein FCF1
VLDTNVLFLAVERGFPLEPEITRLVPGARIVLPSSVLPELGRLTDGRTPGAAAAGELARRFSVEPTGRSGDEGVVDVAVRLGATVATADRALQLRLREQGVDLLVPRDRSRLELRRGARVGQRAPGRASGRRVGGDARATSRGNG